LAHLFANPFLLIIELINDMLIQIISATIDITTVILNFDQRILNWEFRSQELFSVDYSNDSLPFGFIHL